MGKTRDIELVLVLLCSILHHCEALLSSNLQNGDRAYCGQEVVFTCNIPSVTHSWAIQPIGITRVLAQGVPAVDDGPVSFAVATVVRNQNRIVTTATFTAFPDLQRNISSVTCINGAVLNASDENVQSRLPIFQDIVTPRLTVNFTESSTETNCAIRITMLWQDNIDDDMAPVVLVGESPGGGNCIPNISVSAVDRANHNYIFPPFPAGCRDQDHTFCIRFVNGDRCVSDVVSLQPFVVTSVTDPQPTRLTSKSSITVYTDGLETPAIGLIVTLSVLIPSTLLFISGLLLSLLVMSCVMRNKLKSLRDSHESPGDDQQVPPAGPVYDEIPPPSPSCNKAEKFEMGENVAYGPTAVRR